jgi:DNA recombination protein RmuC
MEFFFIGLSLILNGVIIYLILRKDSSFILSALEKEIKSLQTILREEMYLNRSELRAELSRSMDQFSSLQKEKLSQLDLQQQRLIESTERKLAEMRETVDEKLQKTLNERIGKSFELVGKQLEAVQQGIGEMRTMASDVGGLKKILGNVKMRGGIGEVQLSLLLEQILAPEQYESNVKTKKGSSEIVEFAIKLPGKEEGLECVWLPIDAKFPKEYFEKLIEAQESAEGAEVLNAEKNFENAVKKMAKDISEKYLDVPFTTDFGIMFLPFEGIYAEVVRRVSLVEEIQRKYKIIVTGPTTLAALLNSLQMGFRTLAIQKRSGDVWKVLGAIKTEFDKFGGLIEKAQKNIQTGLNDLDTLVGVRTQMIRKKLKSIEGLSDEDAQRILPKELADFPDDEYSSQS